MRHLLCAVFTPADDASDGPLTELRAYSRRLPAAPGREVMVPSSDRYLEWRAGKNGAFAVSAYAAARPPSPHLVYFADSRFELIADVRLDNRADLLNAGSAPADATSDIALLASALANGGQSALADLYGDFAFIAYDRQRGEFLAATDPFGVRPLFVSTARRARDQARFALASHPAMLTPAGEGRPDEAAIRRFSAGIKSADAPRDNSDDGDDGAPEDWCLLKDIERIAPGYLYQFDHQRRRRGPYWVPRRGPQLRVQNEQDYADTLTQLVKRAVSDRLGVGGACELSGGIDSTAIAAFAPSGTTAVTHRFRSLPECDETEYALATARALGMRIDIIDAEQSGALDYPKDHLPELSHPWAIRDPAIVRQFRELQTAGVSTLVTGNGGDEVIGGSVFAYRERLFQGDLRGLAELWRYTRDEGRGAKDYPRLLYDVFVGPFLSPTQRATLRRLLGRGAAASSWSHQAELSAARVALRYKEWPRSKAAILTSLLHGELRATLDSYAFAGAAHGIDVLHPWLDRRIVEFVLASPGHLWNRELYPKWLVRRCLDGLVPSKVVWRTDKTNFGGAYRHGLMRHATFLTRTFKRPKCPEIELGDYSRLAKDLNDRPQLAECPEVFYPLSAQIWLNTHIPALAPKTQPLSETKPQASMPRQESNDE